MTVNDLIAYLQATVSRSPKFGEAEVLTFDAQLFRPGDVLLKNGVQVFPMSEASSPLISLPAPIKQGRVASISLPQHEVQITVTDLRGAAPWEPAAVSPDLTELREYPANAAKDLEHYADDSGLRHFGETCRKRAEFHRRQVALLDSLNPIKP